MLGTQLIKAIVGAPFPAAEEANLLSGNTYIKHSHYRVPGWRDRGTSRRVAGGARAWTMAGLGIGIGLLALRWWRR